jgi:hypothetical protein
MQNFATKVLENKEQASNFAIISHEVNYVNQQQETLLKNKVIPQPVAIENKNKLEQISKEPESKNGRLNDIEVQLYLTKINEVRAAQLFFINEYKNSKEGMERLASDEKFRNLLEALQAKSQAAIAITENNKITTAQKLLLFMQ